MGGGSDGVPLTRTVRTAERRLSGCQAVGAGQVAAGGAASVICPRPARPDGRPLSTLTYPRPAPVQPARVGGSGVGQRRMSGVGGCALSSELGTMRCIIPVFLTLDIGQRIGVANGHLRMV